jgi:hypothetical protein
MEEEKDKFYDVIWSNFMNQFVDKHKNNGYQLTRESYQEFRRSLLDSVD